MRSIAGYYLHAGDSQFQMIISHDRSHIIGNLSPTATFCILLAKKDANHLKATSPIQHNILNTLEAASDPLYERLQINLYLCF